MTHDPRILPSDLPVPVDDGACDHLIGLRFPHVRLASTIGETADPTLITRGRAVIYVYPRTGIPGADMPDGWDSIPGARGCTPQSCSYRDDHVQFQALGVEVYGLSTQSADAQTEFSRREHIPFPLLSDPDRVIGSELDLPTFTVDDKVLYRRLTLILEEGRIVHLRYPVFPPNEDADMSLEWLGSQRFG